MAWAAALDGANGSVGMFGGSYVGFTQMAVAQRRAPALRAIAPMITWDDPDDGVLTRAGVPELGTSANWTLLRGFDQLVKRHRGDGRALGAAIYQLASELDRLPTTGYAELPLGAFGPLERMGMLDAFAAGVQEPRDTALYDTLRVGGEHTRADLPALHIGGWYDVFLRGTIRNFLSMRERNSPAQYLLIGPWTHGNVAHAQGERDFGVAAWGGLVGLRADLMTIQLQFFDSWLKGDMCAFDGVPPVRYFTMVANTWRSAQSWPPQDAGTQMWYLHSAGRLTSDRPDEEQPDLYTYDPANPAPTIGGATLLHASMRSGPWRQNEVERRDDVLVYTSEPLDAPLEVTGDVRVELYVATDAPDTDFVARLVDVQPDGAALTITDGIIRMRHRDG
ncbi:MAG: CocE/NonD family hydrolase, partial [Ktedonobacterales bacterium]